MQVVEFCNIWLTIWERHVLSSVKELFKRTNSVNHPYIILEVLEISGQKTKLVKFELSLQQFLYCKLLWAVL